MCVVPVPNIDLSTTISSTNKLHPQRLGTLLCSSVKAGGASASPASYATKSNKPHECVWKGIPRDLREHLKAYDYKSDSCHLFFDLVVETFMGEYLKKNCSHYNMQCECCTIAII